ncbi:MAG TPA: antibiotic biosynthesis monooxygenase family protein [Acetobacteraceae bacterium]|nr:antibiotic biosynthesis monooxygenase family protein [Acetobacteraceae bacterium]
MFAVIFEVQPKADRWQDYLELAAQLRPELLRVEGFIDNERFRSTRNEGRVLSLSIWEDEKALIRWRTNAGHHGVQEQGRFAVFEDYHLRVGEITADTDLPPGTRLPEQRFDTTAAGNAKVVTISELAGTDHEAPDAAALLEQLRVPVTGGAGAVASEAFTSITTPGKTLLLVSWRTADALAAWQPPTTLGGNRLRHRQVRVIRDYGLADRREAPQYYAPVTR